MPPTKGAADRHSRAYATVETTAHAVDEIAERTSLPFVWRTRADVARRVATSAVLDWLPHALSEAAVLLEANDA